MRIISWNIDGIARRYKELIQLAEEYQPDIIFLQKIKNQQGNANFPIEGYRQLWWFGDSAPYSGVATYCKASITLNHMPIPELSENGHFQMFGLDDLCICNAYVPYSNTSLPESIEFRKKWNKALQDVAIRITQEAKMIILGDMNIVHTEMDNDGHAPLQQNKGCFFEWEREDFNRLLADAHLVDSFRKTHLEKNKYTYYFNDLKKAFQSGWRIDYALVSESLMPQVINSDILTDFGNGKSVPIILELGPTLRQSEKFIGEMERCF